MKYFDKDPQVITYHKQVTKDSYYKWILESSFCCFKSILSDIIYILYCTEKKHMISYDFSYQRVATVIRYAHGDKHISFFKYFLVKRARKELILTGDFTQIKVWDFKMWENIIEIKKAYRSQQIFIDAGCFLVDNNDIYVLTCTSSTEPVKVFNLKGIKKKEINDDKESYFIETYYEERIYVITGNRHGVTSYIYDENEKYREYFEMNKSSGYHCSVAILKSDGITKLIDSCYYYYVRIWDFHSGKLLKKISMGTKELRGICVWNLKYIFVGADDKSIKLIDIQQGKIIKSIGGHKGPVCTIQKIKHPKYGECLVSQGQKNDQIRVFKITSK